MPNVLSLCESSFRYILCLACSNFSATLSDDSSSELLQSAIAAKLMPFEGMLFRCKLILIFFGSVWAEVIGCSFATVYIVSSHGEKEVFETGLRNLGDLGMERTF